MHVVVADADGNFIGNTECDASAITQISEGKARGGVRDNFIVERVRSGLIQKKVAAPSDGTEGSASLAEVDGIVCLWTFRHISNASMEGFNNKIRCQIEQAYLFRDREYF